MLIIKILGFLFVGLMVTCWIFPSVRHLLKETPPSIIKSAYPVITLYGLLVGLGIVYFKELEGSIQQYLENVFLEGVLPGRTSLVLAAVFVSLFFVLGNLTRSYYNLHSIEDEHDGGSALRTLISQFDPPGRFVEGLLRLSMFVIILLLTRTIDAIFREVPNSGSLLSIEAFRILFNGFWRLTRFYYFLLLVWDLVILLGNRRRADTGDSHRISKIMLLEAVPVHVAGLVVSFMMCLPRDSERLSSFVDVFSMVALLAAIVGCCFLTVSAVIESPSLHFWNKRQA